MPVVPQEDVDAARKLPFVKNVTVDELMATVECDGGELVITLTDDYPRGEPMLLGEDCFPLAPGRLPALIREARELGRMPSQPTNSSDGGVFEYQGSAVIEDNAGEACGVFTRTYGNSALLRRPLGQSEWFTLRLPLAKTVDKQTAVAWGLDPTATVDVLLKFETQQFDEQPRPPTIEITQKGKQFQLGQQIRNMLNSYFERIWIGRFAPAVSGTDAVKRAAASIPLPVLSPAQQHVQRELLDMGFEFDHATFAAANCKSSEEALDFDYDAFMRRERARRASSLPDDAAVYNPSTDPNKIVPYSSDKGLLLHIADYILHRLPTSSQYCVVCDKPHVFGANMLRASVCSRDVCVFAFQELQVGTDAADTIATDGGVIDLLIKIFRAAALSNRADKILDPYPHVVDPTNNKLKLFDPARKDLAEVTSVVNAFPSVSEILGCDSIAALKAKIGNRDPRVFPLIEWIINSNRALIIKMHPKVGKLLPSMQTDHQFLLVTAPPDKQKSFVAARAKKGTKFAFHGSRMENWHAIMRNGLKNCSNTELMLCGAAHGSGIYFAREAGTSLGYCHPGQGAQDKDSAKLLPGLIDGRSMICLALCEIVEDAIKDHGWCWTVQDESKVMTRFFFVFEQNTRACSASTANESFMAEVYDAMKFYNVE